MLSALHSKQLGLALQEARKKAGKRQEDIAELLGVSRPTVIAIEKGERLLKSDEIILLRKHFPFDIHRAISVPFVVEPITIWFRLPAQHTLSSDAEEKIRQKAQSFIANARMLDHVLDQSPSAWQSVYSIAHLPPETAAEWVAQKERQRLELGIMPITDMRTLLEENIGIRTLLVDLPSAVSGCFNFSNGNGATIIVNRNHRFGRKNFSFAHEFAHFLAHREQSVPLSSEYNSNMPEERFANAFAQHFLMPRDGVISRVQALIQQNSTLTVGDIVGLAHAFGVSFDAMVRRMIELTILPKEAHSVLKKYNVTSMQEEQGIAEPHQEQFSEHYKRKCFRAYQEEHITLAILAEYLDTDRVSARDFLEGMEKKEREQLLSQDAGTLTIDDFNKPFTNFIAESREEPFHAIS